MSFALYYYPQEAKVPSPSSTAGGCDPGTSSAEADARQETDLHTHHRRQPHGEDPAHLYNPATAAHPDNPYYPYNPLTTARGPS